MKSLSLLLFSLIFLFSCTKPKTEIQKQKKENPLYDKAFEYREAKQIDSAFQYFNRAKDLFLTRKDSLGAGKCLINMGIILETRGDYFGAQEIALNALYYLNKKKKDQHIFLSSNYNNLAIATYKLKDYENAFKFYDLAIHFSTDLKNINLYLNNKAKAYQELKKYNEALNIYDRIFKETNKNSLEYARALTNVSFTKWLQNPNYNPRPELLKALNIRERENDLWGLNSSYASLSYFYSKKNTDSALIYAEKMYRIANKLNSPKDKLQALYRLVSYGPPKKTKQYFEIYEDLSDSLQTVSNIAKNQFALIKYEAEKSKIELLKAKADNIEKEKNMLIAKISVGILIILLIGGYFWLKQKRKLEVKNTELKYVKKVHDRVANRIYQVIDEIDNRPEMQKDEVAEKLDIIYNISRDLSYERIEPKYTQDFAKELAAMFSSYQSTRVSIEINGNEDKLWSGIKDAVKSEVFIILQELMTNMSKHSEANHVQLNFLRDKEHITILYFDNGKGIENFLPGNGLRNTETRIKSISGIITFDTKPHEGLNIKFSFPI
ncbi:tetratricopeptide repeat-containing sensor histidine kinase [Pedobacter nototheniae]|uniref:tetratricopeptide repeat-containing sensor histidine kinase n=1 Tax=Pedobacter nototheniae TaxID=2488994 RepID=UPI00103E79DD|nr:tetratricopeptide repeat-containing sensor histidine kinase [Pedobacter nototheniae]